MLKTSIFTVAASIALAANCAGAGDPGVSGGQFLRIGVGAKISALGESGAASSGAQSMFYNPAGLNDVKNTEFSFSQAQWIMDINYSNLAMAKKTKAGAFGLAVSYLSVPPIAKYDKFGTRLSDNYSAMDMAVALGYSRQSTPRAGWGLDIKYISSKLEADAATAIAVDAGIKYAAIPGSLDLGFVAQNIGTKLKYINESDPLPLNFKFGGRYTLKLEDETDFRRNVSIFTDLNHMKDSSFYASVGADFTVRYSGGTSFSVRGGYRTDISSKDGGLAFGFGADIKRWTIDYAYSPMGDLGKAHKISLTLKFSKN
ncbi:MAG TPA: hypothetical protein DCL44_12155 [Elusimicrobia bacterium]|nr:hypothetical protein [Elusimicrobiota bacterium]